MLAAVEVVLREVDAAAGLAAEEDGAAERSAALVGRVWEEGRLATERLNEAELAGQYQAPIWLLAKDVPTHQEDLVF